MGGFYQWGFSSKCRIFKWDTNFSFWTRFFIQRDQQHPVAAELTYRFNIIARGENYIHEDYYRSGQLESTTTTIVDFTSNSESTAELAPVKWTLMVVQFRNSFSIENAMDWWVEINEWRENCGNLCWCIVLYLHLRKNVQSFRNMKLRKPFLMLT